MLAALEEDPRLHLLLDDGWWTGPGPELAPDDGESVTTAWTSPTQLGLALVDVGDVRAPTMAVARRGERG